MIQLSHSAKNKYLECPLAYYMHYVLRYRENQHKSALPFGTAIDEALNTLLETKDSDNALEDALNVFDTCWTYVTLNDKRIDLENNPHVIGYSKTDLDENLVNPALGKARASFESLKIKGQMFIEQYAKEILPKIKRVIKVQAPVRIENDRGDYIIGFADAIVEWEDGRIICIDNKTTSVTYAKDCVTAGDKAKQLALYWAGLKSQYNLDAVGFITLDKRIRKKKQPRVRIETYLGVPSDDLIDATLEEFQDVLTGIRMGRFPSNYPECSKGPFGPCICCNYSQTEGEDMTGLIYVKKGKR